MTEPELTSFGTITISNVLNEDSEHHIKVEFGELTILEVFGMLEMARLQAIQQGLGLLDD